MNIIELVMKLMQEHTVSELAIVEVGEVESELTPYAIAMLINDTLLELGSDKAVRPQMMYQYAKKGMIVGDGVTKLRYNHSEAAAFVVKYIHRNITK